MADKKISDLPLTPAVNTDDTFEKSRHNAAPSERMTSQQLYTAIETALSRLVLTGGTISLNADGSASLAGGFATITAAGNLSCGDLNCPSISVNGGTGAIASDGSITGSSAAIAGGQIQLTGAGELDAVNAQFGNGGILLNADGSTSFANGAVTIDAAGNLGALSFDAAGGVHQLLSDGSASFDNGVVTVAAADGSLTVDNGAGAIKLDASTGSVVAANDVEVTSIGQGFVLKSPNGSRWRIAVSNIGVLSAAPA